jgi:endonuclease/exonuclease/phosphatase family metal-dependent hydrolase
LNGHETLLCGDFNFEPTDDEYLSITRPFGPCALVDGWRVSHDGQPHEATFCVHEQVYKPRPIACDFVFLTQGLAERVWQFRVDTETRASDHQPVLIELR